MTQIAPLLRGLFALLRPQRARIGLMIGLVLLDAAYGAISAWSLRLLIDRAVIPQDIPLLILLLGALALGLVLAAVATLLLERVSARIAATAGGDLRKRLFTQLQELPMATLDRLRRGDVVARFSGDIGLFETVVSGVVPGAIRALASLTLGLLLLASLHPLLLLLAVVLLPLCIIGPRLFGHGAGLAAHRRRDAEGQIATAVAESLTAAVIVRGYGLAGRLTERFSAKVDASVETAVDAAFRAGLAHRSSGLGILLAELAGLALASVAAIGGHISIGELVAFQALLLLVCQGLLSLTQLYPAALDGAASLARIDQLLYQAPEATDPAHGANVNALRTAIRFEQVRFAYDPARPALQNLDLRVAAGEWLSLVGPSGAGKSSVLHLLMRLAAPDAGHITWDGTDIASLRRTELRARLGYVPQDSVLFDASLADNIALFDPHCDAAAIQEAARLAGVEAFALRLPQGLETRVGENGSALSGGQRQRVAIARALLRLPDVLLLDEPTSALDTETEAELLVTLRALAGRHTLLLVTHRPAPALAADRVAYVAEGRVLDSGEHLALLARCAPYQRLFSAGA